MNTVKESDYFQQLAHQWQREKSQPEFTVEKALRSQRKFKLKYYAHICITLLMLVVAGWFLTLPFAIISQSAGLVILVTVLMDWIYIARFRRPITNWVDWSPTGLLQYRESVLKGEITTAKYFIFGSFVLLGFTVYVWVLAFSDTEIYNSKFHLIFSAVSIPCAFVFILIYRKKLKRCQSQKVLVHNLVDEQND